MASQPFRRAGLSNPVRTNQVSARRCTWAQPCSQHRESIGRLSAGWNLRWWRQLRRAQSQAHGSTAVQTFRTRLTALWPASPVHGWARLAGSTR